MDENIKQQLLHAVCERIRIGALFEAIAIELKTAGYEDGEISSVYSEARLIVEKERSALTSAPVLASTSSQPSTSTPSETVLETPVAKKRSFKKILLYIITGILVLITLLVVGSFWLVSGSRSMTAQIPQFQKELLKYREIHGADYSQFCEYAGVSELLEKLRRHATKVECSSTANDFQVIAEFKDTTALCKSAVTASSMTNDQFACVSVPFQLSSQTQTTGNHDNDKEMSEIQVIPETIEQNIKPEKVTLVNGVDVSKITLPLNLPRNGQSNDINFIGNYGNKLGFVAGDLNDLLLIGGKIQTCLLDVNSSGQIISLKPFHDTFLATISQNGGARQFYKGCEQLAEEYPDDISSSSDPAVFSSTVIALNKAHGPFQYGMETEGGVTSQHVMFAGRNEQQTVIFKNGVAIKTLEGMVKWAAFSPSGSYAYQLDKKIFINDSELLIPKEISLEYFAPKGKFIGEKLLVTTQKTFFFDTTWYQFSDNGYSVTPYVLDEHILFTGKERITENGKQAGLATIIYFDSEAPWAEDLMKSVNMIDYYRRHQ